MADLLWDQPTLDLWSIEAIHQIGQIRLPWARTPGGRVGCLIPAWRCCRCGGVELNRYLWELSHGCCGPSPRFQSCPEPGGRYDMRPHWVPSPVPEPAAGGGTS